MANAIMINPAGGTDLPSGIGCVDLGSLNWSYNHNTRFLARLPADLHAKPASSDNANAEILCASYQTSTNNIIYSGTEDKVIALNVETPPYLSIRDTDYGTDTAAFKAAMSGILLFYKKI